MGAAFIAALGAAFGLSFSPLASVGAVLSLVAIGLFGSAFSIRRRRRGKASALGWLYAVVIVVGLNVLAWKVALFLLQ